MLAAVVSMFVCCWLMMQRGRSSRYLRLLMNRRARHAKAAGDRVERQHGDQQPEQECLEGSVHSRPEYITTIFG